MPINTIAKDKQAAARCTGAHMGMGMDVDDGLIYVNRTGTRELMHTDQVAIVTGATVLTAADHGKTVIINSTTSRAITLPATQAGLTFTVALGNVTAGAGHSLSPAAVDKIFCTGLTAVDNKDLIFTGATDTVGDFVTVVGDGVDGWYVTASGGTLSKEA